ncbi:glycosyltransferase family 4 protein [Caenimonas aquaedulcis]|uniref:Glycosyltransferase family 4 protein n=1 Tax=Caenimonas aquaedulcis TaxID=2793270 RepID=A0A931MIV1_9BURK|nr:glycosyltransferase family 4 protein [Caenimonas aquaedulcis]MBG9390108.1 glycosyltransferase family 4 protein [Caenimonas aquaedulcis]
MPDTAGSLPSTAAARASRRYIYIACPWTPVGGGMFKVADYLIQSQEAGSSPDSAELRPLDTRGGGSAFASMFFLLSALVKLVQGRISGDLAGVHVNMAERLSLWRKSAVVVFSHMLGIPVVLHLHAAQLHHYYRALPSLLRRVVRWVFSLPDSVVVLGGAAERFVVDELLVPKSRVEIVINGVPEPVDRSGPRRVDGVQRVLFLGNLSERKGVSDLLNALAQPGFESEGVEVVIAGGGDVPGYEAKARELGVDRFTRFAGWCDQRQVAQLMSRTDVLVLPSYDEGLPLVILEALAHGVAVVCTPVGEIPTALTDNENALFVQPGDVPGIAAALTKVLRDKPLQATLGSNGRALYEQRYSLARFFASIARIHQKHFGVSGRFAQPSGAGSTSREATP